MNANRILPAFCVLLLAAPAAWADQAFKVSRDLGLVSTDLNMIVNPLTGDLYVLITQLDVDNRSYSRVFGSLIRNQPQAMNFAPGTPRLLSADSGWQGRASAIYALSIKRFVVVWDERGVEGPEHASRILGRQVAPNGKPKGGIATVLDNGDSNDYPQIVDLLDDDCWDDEPPPLAYQFYLAWNGNRPAGGDDRPTHGLNLAPLRIGRNLIRIEATHVNLLESNKQGAGVGPYPEISSSFGRFRAGGVGEFGISLSGTRYVDNGGQYAVQGFNYRMDIDTDTALAKITRRLDTPLGLTVPHSLGVSAGPSRWDQLFSVAYNPQTKRLNQMLWQDDQWTDPEEVKIRDFVSFAGQVIRIPTFNRNESAPRAEPAAKPVYGYLVAAASDGWVYAQKITAAGTYLRKPKKIFSHGNALQAMWVYHLDHDASPYNTVIFWQKKVSETVHEAWAYFTNLK